MASSEKLCLNWNDFAANITNTLYDLKEDKDFTDLTLVCADKQVDVHKVVLASSSQFFRRVLKNIKHSHPLIYLSGIKFKDLEAVLSFMYLGQVNLAQEDLDSFLAVAEELGVKGLTPGENLSNCDANSQTQGNSCGKSQESACSTHPGCSASFTQAWIPERHMKTHTGKRPFPCPYESCGDWFKSQGEVNQHIKKAKKHEGHRKAAKIIDKYLLPFTCQVEGCVNRYETEIERDRHMEKLHS